MAHSLGGDFDEVGAVIKRLELHACGQKFGIQFIDLNEIQEDRIADCIEQVEEEHLELEKQGGKTTILMVDDVPESIKPFERQLHIAGYKVILATSGIEAMQEMDRNKVDLVIIDLLMDRMNGFMLIKLIKQTQKFKNIPIAVLSAASQGDADIEKASRLGIVRFFMKHNTKPQAFAEEVTRILHKARTN